MTPTRTPHFVSRRAAIAGLFASCAFPAARAQDAIAPEAWARRLAQPVPMPEGSAGRFLGMDVSFDPAARLSKAEQQAWEQQLRAIAASLGQAPVVASPVGYYPAFHGFGAVQNLGDLSRPAAKLPMAGGVALMPWMPQDVSLDAQGNPKRKPGTETHLFRVELNFVYPLTGAAWMSDDEGDFGMLRVQGRFQGFPIVNDDLLLTRDGRLPYRPVSRERALKAYLSKYAQEEKRVQRDADEARRAYEAYQSPAEQAARRAKIDAEVATLHDPYNRDKRRQALEMWDRKDGERLRAAAQPDPANDPAYARLQALRAAERTLADSSPQERASPAWVDADPQRHQVDPALVPAGKGVQLMALDGSYFAHDQPRTTLRVARIRVLRQLMDAAEDQRPGSGAAARVGITLLQQTDWQMFAQRFLVAR